MNKIEPNIDESWKLKLQPIFNTESFFNLKDFLLEDKKRFRIFPKGEHIFNAFDLTPFDRLKVVILGQDPYHGPGQAHGLAFSVMDGIRHPPSLRNIFKELKNDVGIEIPKNGNLEKWAQQGVLLLNSCLTVREREAASHKNQGWEEFTDGVIRIISEQKEHVVFILWGNFAQQKRVLIDESKHHVLTATHPSPFSADRGFFGSRHFSRTNEYLKKHQIHEIDWSLE